MKNETAAQKATRELAEAILRHYPEAKNDRVVMRQKRTGK